MIFLRARSTQELAFMLVFFVIMMIIAKAIDLIRNKLYGTQENFQELTYDRTLLQSKFESE